MLTKPAFKSFFQVETIESVGVFLIAESEHHLLTGRTYELLAPLIDGNLPVAEIINKLQGQVSAAEVYYALMMMEKDSYIIETDPQRFGCAHRKLPGEIAALADFLKVDRNDAASRLQSTKIAVRTLGPVNPQPLLSRLESLNLQVSAVRLRSPQAVGDLEVVLTDDYLHEGLAEINQQALQSQRPWMLVKPVGTTLWIGPIFHPEKTGCWECLAQRLRANRPVESFIQRKKGITDYLPTSVSLFPFTSEMGLDLAAQEILKWTIQQQNESLEGTLVTLDTMTLKTQNHTLVKRPQCPVCGEAEYLSNPDPTPIILKSCKKTFTADGGHRCYTPEATLKKYEHHLSSITGAVRYLRQMSFDGNELMHLYYSGHNFARSNDNLYFLRQGCRSRSAGKGKTEIQAKSGALCEALERYSGLFQGYETRYKGTYQGIGPDAIHPNACMNFSEEQYRTREEWNASCGSKFNMVYEPFDEEAEIEWTPVWSLTHKKFKYLPTAFCYYDYPDYPNTVCGTDSNGCAAGNTIEEAILQGFMELVERDAIALWWYNMVRRPAVDLESFDEPYCQGLQEYYKTINREFWVLDVTSDFNIPVFAAISRRTDKPAEDIIFGFGAHFDAQIAMLRAVTEMNQILPSVLSVAPDGSVQYNASEELATHWWKTATIENQPYLRPEPNAVTKRYCDYPNLATDDLKEDVNICMQLVEKQNMEMLVVDQSRPDLGLNVVKVIVPGMRHFWNRLAPGRLYDVPMQLGWLSEPLPENQLNPLPMFL